jgi:ribosomal protein L22
MVLGPRRYVRLAYPNIPGPHGHAGRHIGAHHMMTKKHAARSIWYRSNYDSKPYFGIQKHVNHLPRVLLDRDVQPRVRWAMESHIPDAARWERIVNGMRWAEDRVHYVEEDGQMHAVNWKLYSDRLNAELQQTVDQLPSFVLHAKAAPMGWKKLDIRFAWARGLSLREAMAQCKLGNSKSHTVLLHFLERVQQGAENKGLDKEKLRIHIARVSPGLTDRQIDIKSRGYYAWKVKKSSTIVLGVVEDPEMVLPDRTVLPYQTQLNLRKAGIATEETVLDVPAITAEGI